MITNLLKEILKVKMLMNFKSWGATYLMAYTVFSVVFKAA